MSKVYGRDRVTGPAGPSSRRRCDNRVVAELQHAAHLLSVIASLNVLLTLFSYVWPLSSLRTQATVGVLSFVTGWISFLVHLNYLSVLVDLVSLVALEIRN